MYWNPLPWFVAFALAVLAVAVSPLIWWAFAGWLAIVLLASIL